MTSSLNAIPKLLHPLISTCKLPWNCLSADSSICNSNCASPPGAIATGSPRRLAQSQLAVKRSIMTSAQHGFPKVACVAPALLGERCQGQYVEREAQPRIGREATGFEPAPLRILTSTHFRAERWFCPIAARLSSSRRRGDRRRAGNGRLPHRARCSAPRRSAGAGSREPGAGSREPGAGSRDARFMPPPFSHGQNSLHLTFLPETLGFVNDWEPQNFLANSAADRSRAFTSMRSHKITNNGLWQRGSTANRSKLLAQALRRLKNGFRINTDSPVLVLAVRPLLVFGAPRCEKTMRKASR